MFGGDGGHGSADVLESFQAAVIFSDRVSVQAAETGDKHLTMVPLHPHGHLEKENARNANASVIAFKLLVAFFS